MLAAEVTRGFDNDGDDVGTSVAIGTEGNAVAAELEWGAGLGAGGYFHGDFAVDGLDFDFGAKGGVNHTDVLLRKNDGAFAGEVFVGFDSNANIKIAWFGAGFRSGAAFAAKLDGHTVVNAGGDFDFEVFTFDSDGFGGAEDGFFEGKSDRCLIIRATTRTSGALSAEETA